MQRISIFVLQSSIDTLEKIEKRNTWTHRRTRGKKYDEITKYIWVPMLCIMKRDKKSIPWLDLSSALGLFFVLLPEHFLLLNTYISVSLSRNILSYKYLAETFELLAFLGYLKINIVMRSKKVCISSNTTLS